MTNLNDVPLSALAGLTYEQRHAVAALLERERQFMTRWWTHLNEMRGMNELPDWAKSNGVGTEADVDCWRAACTNTNEALFGKERDSRSPEASRWAEVSFEEWESDLERRSQVTAVRKIGLVKQPGAVRQHRPGQTTLGSTNVRISS